MEAYEVRFLSVFSPVLFKGRIDLSCRHAQVKKKKKYVTAKKESDREKQEWDTNSLE